MKFKDLPNFAPGDLDSPAAMVRKLNQITETLQVLIGTRGPDKGMAAWDASMMSSGLIDKNGSALGQPPGSSDTSPPPIPSGLSVTPGINHVFVEWTAPTYSQGGGNAYTTVYGATYTSGPLPTFADSVALATVPFGTQIYSLPTEPNVTWHIWVTFTTYADKESAPAGGINGVSATSGQLDGAQHIEALTVTRALIADLAVDDAKVANLSAGKLTAGSIAVGEYIQSSGFVSGSSGWRINGDGTAEFSGVLVRGTIYASAGQIGGASIGSNYVQSSTYGAGSGWRLDNSTGGITAAKVRIANAAADRIFDTDATGNDPVLQIGTALKVEGDGDATLGTLTLAGALKMGQSAYNTGLGAWAGWVGGTFKVSMGSPSGPYFLYDGTDIVIKSPTFDPFTATISGGNIVWTGGSYPSRSVSVSGGRAPYNYVWVLIRSDIAATPVALSGQATSSVTVGWSGISSPLSGRLMCFVTDANGRITLASVTFSADGVDTGGWVGSP